MSTVPPTHPVLANIRSLADEQTWRVSVELADAAIPSWLEKLGRPDFARVYLVGCGTSYYAAQVGKHFLEHLAHLPAEAQQAFAFATYAEPALLGPRALVVGISTSGESEAVRDALARASEAGATTLALTAFAETSVARAAGAVILTGGTEDRVPVKTSSYVQSLVTVYLLALRLAEALGTLDADAIERWRGQIDRAAEGARRLLGEAQPQIEELAARYASATEVFVLGTGPNAGTAEEAALKVIEMAKLPAEARELEDFLHGRLREVDQVNPLWLIAPPGRASARVLDFLTVTDHVRAPSVVITSQVTSGIRRLATHVVRVPAELEELATPLLYIMPLHLFAFHLALRRGWEPLSRRYEDIVPQKVRYTDHPLSP